METRTFFVPGTPRGQQRPRFVRKLGIAFTPKETRVAADDVRGDYLAQYAGQPLWEGPIRLLVGARYDIPSSRPGWYKHQIVCGPSSWPRTIRPDLDNIVKLVKDALSKVAWKDDAQVFEIVAGKWWCLGNEVPGTQITIEHCPELVPTKPPRARKPASRYDLPGGPDCVGEAVRGKRRDERCPSDKKTKGERG